MKFYQSIRFRVVAGTLLFGAVLIFINSLITFFLLGKDVNRLIENLLSTEMDYFLYQYEKDRTAPLPHSRFIKAFKGIEEVPEQFRETFRGLEPGIHTLPHLHKKRMPHQVGVIRLPDTGAVYYFKFHGREFFRENNFLNPREILLLSLALLLIPGTVIGMITSRVMFRPVNELMDMIRGLNPENIPDRWSVSRQKGEIGMLTSTIESAMNRIREFIRREKQFTRDASHELRTPLTVIKGAVEIMQEQPETRTNPMLGNPLGRIEISVRDMENIIETFLWLAREENDPGETADVKTAVEKAVESNRYLLESKDVALEMDFRCNPVLPVKEEVLYITVTNLIRNAFQFTHKGSVSIRSEKECLTIEDTGMGIEPDHLDSVTQTHIRGESSRGFGLGLSIVARLCKRFGWELNISSQPGEGTVVTIGWHVDTDGSRL